MAWRSGALLGDFPVPGKGALGRAISLIGRNGLLGGRGRGAGFGEAIIFGGVFGSGVGALA